MKIVALVPIKLNNERFPNKNIRRFDDGTPLCQLMFNTLSNIEEIDEIYCYCSNPKIKEYLTGRVKFLQRSKSLDTSETKAGDFIAAFLDDVQADIVVLGQVTGPFIKADSVKKCISAVASGKYDSAFSALKLQEFLWKDDQPLNYDPTSIPRTQNLPVMYEESNAIFVFTEKLFHQSHRRIGFNPYICEISKIEAIDIDYPEDFEIANAVYMHLLRKSGGGGDNRSHLPDSCSNVYVAEIFEREAA